MLPKLTMPNPQPARKVPGYEMPDTANNLLAWRFVANAMESAEYYWIASVNSRNAPHVVPLWGLWFENRIHFDGSPKTGWARNLMANERVAVNLPNAEQVVIVYGRAVIMEDDELSDVEWTDLDTRYQQKYNVQEGSPYWVVHPTKVLAWNGGDLKTMTRWIFDEHDKGE